VQYTATCSTDKSTEQHTWFSQLLLAGKRRRRRWCNTSLTSSMPCLRLVQAARCKAGSSSNAADVFVLRMETLQDMSSM
jgi:hypothetical protein